MSNIRQQTQLDLQGPIIYKNIYVAGEQIVGVPYQTIQFESGAYVSKFGYCVNDNEGISYPIYICFTDEDTEGKPFYIGKTGMFEIQEEELPNVSETGDPQIVIYVKRILVCKNVPFVIDYYYT